jgi:hypothetical protein
MPDHTRDDAGIRDARETIAAEREAENFGLAPLETFQTTHDDTSTAAADGVRQDASWKSARHVAVMAEQVYTHHAGEVAKVQADPKLSDEGKRERVAQLEAERDVELGRITGELDRALGLAERAFPPQPRAEARTQADSMRVQAKLVAYPHWHPRAVLTDLRDLVVAGDRVAITYVLPYLERQIASPSPWWRAWLPLARDVVEAGQLVLATDKAAMAHRIAAEQAETMRGQLKFALTMAAKDGKWDRHLLWGTGVLSQFEAPADFVRGRRRPND